MSLQNHCLIFRMDVVVERNRIQVKSNFWAISRAFGDWELEFWCPEQQKWHHWRSLPKAIFCLGINKLHECFLFICGHRWRHLRVALLRKNSCRKLTQITFPSLREKRASKLLTSPFWVSCSNSRSRVPGST